MSNNEPSPYMYRLILLSVVIVTFIIFAAIITCRIRCVLKSCIFINRSKMIDIINASPYFTRMSKYDLIVRRSETEEDYKTKYINSVINFTCREKQKLCYLVGDANALLERYKNISAIPWKFAKLSNGIENNWPHTLGDVIMLHSSFFDNTKEEMIKTLIHEKIHVYQRLCTNYTNILISLYMGYKYYNEMGVLENIMNNPDVDGKLYTIRGRLIFRGYDRPYPNNLLHTKLYECILDKSGRIVDILETSNRSLNYPDVITQVDHPYEIMAQLISHNLAGFPLSTPNINKWMILYL